MSRARRTSARRSARSSSQAASTWLTLQRRTWLAMASLPSARPKNGAIASTSAPPAGSAAVTVWLTAGSLAFEPTTRTSRSRPSAASNRANTSAERRA